LEIKAPTGSTVDIQQWYSGTSKVANMTSAGRLVAKTIQPSLASGYVSFSGYSGATPPVKFKVESEAGGVYYIITFNDGLLTSVVLEGA
jgi:hypothetical protein